MLHFIVEQPFRGVAGNVSHRTEWQRRGVSRRPYIRSLKLDGKGRFNLKVYGDFNYEIRAEGWGRIRGESKRVPIGEKSTGLKLVLQPVE